jgi:hypothetical protein
MLLGAGYVNTGMIHGLPYMLWNQNLVRPESGLVTHRRAVSDIEADVIIRNPSCSAKLDLPKSGECPEASLGEFRIEIRIDAGKGSGAYICNGNGHESLSHTIFELQSHDR